MDTKLIVELMYTYMEPILGLVVLAALWYSRQLRNILPLTLLMSVTTFSDISYVVLHALAMHERAMGVKGDLPAYDAYFTIHWTCYVLSAICTYLLIRRLYQMALDPLMGLQHLGMIVFRWVAVASILIAVFASVTPKVTAVQFIISAATQLQRTQSIMVLCLLFFLTCTAKPLAFTYRSRIFGVGMGLGLIACNDLVESAWIAQNSSIYTYYNVIKGVVIFSAMVMWIAYYVMPEAKRGLVTLPVSSPLLRWNDIGIALGYPETHVVVTAEGRPILGDAEVEAMRVSQRKSIFSSRVA